MKSHCEFMSVYSFQSFLVSPFFLTAYYSYCSSGVSVNVCISAHSVLS